jgi:hypothetical protein
VTDDIDKLRRIKERVEGDGVLDGEMNFEGEVTVRVIDEDGEEKHKQVKSIDGGE